MEERLAQYHAATEARVPLDFSTELLPAETRVHDKVDLGPDASAPDDSFEEGGLFRKRRRRIRRFAHVQQIDEMDCGAACLGMICRHFGRAVSLARIRELCHTSRDGTSLRALCQAATELGLAARALKVSLRNLPDMPLPAIVHWEGNHWMVLVDVGASRVRVDDPSLGSRRIARPEFEQKWSGYAALFDYTDAFDRAPEARATLAWLAPFVTRYRGVLAQALLLALVVTILQLLFPIFTQVVVDKVIVENDVSLLNIVLLSMAVTLVFMQLANLIQEYVLSFAAVRIDTAILDFLTRRLLSLPLLYFSSRRTGDIQRRLDGARQVRQFAVQHGIGGLLSVLTVAGAVGLMIAYSPTLAAVFLATIPLYAGMAWFSVKVLRPLFADIEESQGKYASHQVDAIKGIEAVKAASGELAFRDRCSTSF
jgi:ATP-binding cassette subfamily B protein